MIRVIFSFVVIAALSFTMTSCSDDETSGDGKMTAGVDGTNWTQTLGVIVINNSGVWSVTGTDGSANQLQINIIGYTGAGTYAIGGSISSTNAGRWTEGINAEDTYTTAVGQGAGTLIVTSDDGTTVEGTFEFTCKNTAQTERAVTNGIFSATY